MHRNSVLTTPPSGRLGLGSASVSSRATGKSASVVWSDGSPQRRHPMTTQCLRGGRTQGMPVSEAWRTSHLSCLFSGLSPDGAPSQHVWGQHSCSADMGQTGAIRFSHTRGHTPQNWGQVRLGPDAHFETASKDGTAAPMERRQLTWVSTQHPHAQGPPSVESVARVLMAQPRDGDPPTALLECTESDPDSSHSAPPVRTFSAGRDHTSTSGLTSSSCAGALGPSGRWQVKLMTASAPLVFQQCRAVEREEQTRTACLCCLRVHTQSMQPICLFSRNTSLTCLALFTVSSCRQLCTTTVLYLTELCACAISVGNMVCRESLRCTVFITRISRYPEVSGIRSPVAGSRYGAHHRADTASLPRTLHGGSGA
jgi:hypothetical protein